jgi:4'-phosphopantetheinyl transferase
MERLEQHHVDVWFAVPDALTPEDLTAFDRLMTAEERTKQQRFVFDRNKKESLVTRGVVRTTLSRYRAVAPEAWRFSANEHGCPAIDPPCGLRFNLSNNPGMVVCAVAEDADVGVDVEPIARGTEVLGVAERVFSARERAELQGDPDRAVSLWTLKEAYIKARGVGVALGLEKITMLFDGPHPRVELALDDDASRWTFRIVDVEGFRIAIALDTGGAVPHVRVRRWMMPGTPFP